MGFHFRGVALHADQQQFCWVADLAEVVVYACFGHSCEVSAGMLVLAQGLQGRLSHLVVQVRRIAPHVG